MSDRNLKLRVAFEAIDKLSGSVRSIAKGSKAMAGELAGARKEMDRLKAVEAKLAGFRKLKAGLSQSEAKLKEQQRSVAALAREMKKAERPSAALSKKFTAAKNASAKAKAEYGQQRMKLEQLRRELDKAGFATKDLVDSERRLRREMEKTNSTIDEKKSGLGGIHRARGRAEKMRGAGIGATAAVTAPAMLFGQKAFGDAMAKQELDDAFNTTFKQNAAEMNAWAEATGNAMQRSTTAMKTGAQAFGLFFNEAAPPGRAAAMSREMAVLAEDLESFHNLQAGQGIEKLRAGLSGESEPLKQLGIMINETTVKQKAYQMGLAKTGQALTENQKIEARYALIMEKTKNAQGNVIQTSDSTANQLRSLGAANQELSEAIGEKLLPALTPLITRLAEFLTWLSNLSPTTQTVILSAIALAAAFGPLLLVIGPLLLGIARLHKGISLLRQLGTVGKVFTALRTAALFMAKGVMRAGVMMMANPIILAIVLLVAALAVAGYMIYTHWDTIKAAFWKGVAAVAQAWEGLKGLLSAGLEWFVGLHVKFLQIGRDIVLGIANGIRNAGGAVLNALKNLVLGGVDWVKSMLDINSPSRVFMALGEATGEGLAIGIDRRARSAVGAAGRLAAGVTAAGSLALSPVATASPTPDRAAAANAAGAGGGVTINIYQQPGEDGEALARRVMQLIEQKQGAAARRSYEDDT